MGHLSIGLPDIVLSPIASILLPRRMTGDVTSQIHATRLPHRHPLSGKEYRSLMDRQVTLHRRRGNLARLKPKDRLAAERAIHRRLTLVDRRPLCSIVPLVVPVQNQFAAMGAVLIGRHLQRSSEEFLVGCSYSVDRTNDREQVQCRRSPWTRRCSFKTPLKRCLVSSESGQSKRSLAPITPPHSPTFDQSQCPVPTRMPIRPARPSVTDHFKMRSRR